MPNKQGFPINSEGIQNSYEVDQSRYNSDKLLSYIDEHKRIKRTLIGLSIYISIAIVFHPQIVQTKWYWYDFLIVKNEYYLENLDKYPDWYIKYFIRLSRTMQWLLRQVDS